MFVVNIESAKKRQSNEENIHSSICVYCSLFLLITKSLFPISYVTAGCFAPALKTPKKREKPNFERNFLAKKTGNEKK